MAKCKFWMNANSNSNFIHCSQRLSLVIISLLFKLWFKVCHSESVGLWMISLSWSGQFVVSLCWSLLRVSKDLCFVVCVMLSAKRCNDGLKQHLIRTLNPIVSISICRLFSEINYLKIPSLPHNPFHSTSIRSWNNY